MEALKYVIGLVQILVGAWCWHLYSQQNAAKDEADRIAKELANHKLHTAETYMTKSESTRAFDTLSRTLESLLVTVNHRFDRTDSKLDSKMDKGNTP